MWSCNCVKRTSLIEMVVGRGNCQFGAKSVMRMSLMLAISLVYWFLKLVNWRISSSINMTSTE